MSSVTLISNPTPDVTTYEWRPVGVSQLMRENKLTSPPFWMPNAQMRKYQFRFIMLRGLVEAKEAKDDPYGLIVELLQPPPDADVGKTGPAIKPPSAYPGGCSITVLVVSHDNDTKDITATAATIFSEENLQVSFPELISYEEAQHAAYLVGEPLTFTLRVTIQFGVSVVAQHVVNTVSSLWTSFLTSVDHFVGKTAEALQEGRKELEELVQHSMEEDSTPHGKALDPPPPWEVPPPKWAARAEAWRHLVSEQIVEDDGVYLYGPERSITEGQRNVLLEVGLNYHALLEKYNEFDYDRDISVKLLESRGIRQNRYILVPSRIKEEIFWANYFWKVACLGVCESETQVRALLTVLNAPPLPKSGYKEQVGPTVSNEVVAKLKDAQEASDILMEYLSDTKSTDGGFLMEAAAVTCEGHLRLLELLQGQEMEEETSVLLTSTLQRLRERIDKYHDMVSQRPNGANEIPSATSRESVALNEEDTAPPVNEMPSLQPEPKRELSGEAALPTQTPPPCPSHTEQKKEEDHTDSLVESQKGSVEYSKHAVPVDFPKMPWEE
ncbi:unnamed protein product [Phytomonas sp. EM1]|nr:unnamed protein product [Phytomonas sp. EM1]|eukprot:CCW64227.1 unnamed protein product [Phytomonas sp. isolate EM1]